jgi:hypothetical protein
MEFGIIIALVGHFSILANSCVFPLGRIIICL